MSKFYVKMVKRSDVAKFVEVEAEDEQDAEMKAVNLSDEGWECAMVFNGKVEMK